LTSRKIGGLSTIFVDSLPFFAFISRDFIDFPVTRGPWRFVVSLALTGFQSKEPVT
jgi:hypothetical protein